MHPAPPLWRRQRPQLLPDAAEFYPSDPEMGTLTLRCSLNLLQRIALTKLRHMISSCHGCPVSFATAWPSLFQGHCSIAASMKQIAYSSVIPEQRAMLYAAWVMCI